MRLTVILLMLLLGSFANANPPNIIVILVDDMGYSDLGAFGGEVDTPHLDRLAEEGLRFTQNYNSARCCPSRATLLTGLYSHQTGIANFTGGDQSHRLGPAYRGRLNKQCVTLAEVLKTVGYQTYCVGKWHVGHEESPVERGFDEFYGYTRGHSTSQWKPGNYRRLPEGRTPEKSFEDDFYATDAFNQYAVEFIRQAEGKNAPFFLYLAHSSPHFPLHAPARTRDRYLARYRRGWDVLRAERYQRQEESGLVAESWSLPPLSDVPVDRDDIANHYAGKPNPKWDELPEDRREDLAYRMATFAAMIDHVDQGVGHILDQLERSGQIDNTLILFTSDNGACYEWGPFGFDRSSRKGFTQLHKGEELEGVGGPGTYHSVGSGWSCLSNTPLRMYKHFNHEGGNCSPLLAWWPNGIEQPDRWVRSPIHLMDIMPTICEVSGAKYPKTFSENTITPLEGRSLFPFFKGATSRKPRMLCFDHFESSAIREGDWKLVRGNKRYLNRTWELYNIAKDRCETTNLIDQMPEKASALEAKWMDWAVRMKISPYYKHKASPQKAKATLKRTSNGTFLLPLDTPVDTSAAPDFKKKSFTVSASFEIGSGGNGVLVSHGGNRYGYALYVQQGVPVFSVREKSQLYTIKGSAALSPGTHTLTARLLARKRMEIEVDGKPIARGSGPEFISNMPQDPLEVGADNLSTVAESYGSTHRFNGSIHEVRFKVD